MNCPTWSENPSASQQPDNVNIEQADYDRDTDYDDDPDEEEQPPAGNPKLKAMPHPKLVPKSPPPTLRLVSKAKPAPKNTLDEETESDNNPGERPALTSNDRWCTSEESDSGIYLQRISVPRILDSSPSWPNTTGSALPSSTRIRTSTSFLSMNENLEPGYSG